MNKCNKEMSHELRKDLLKKSYGLVGKHSAVQICNWTKNSIRGGQGCWKEKFYGIKSHRCAEVSPAVVWCENNCLHCWRPIEMNLGINLPCVDNPVEIIDKMITERKKLLIGFGGNKKVDKKKLEESFSPSMFTFSLSGEATLYPKLGEMIRELRKRKIITFLVTNGQNPDALKKLEKEKALPTQFVISLNAPNKELFNFWHKSRRKDAWIRFNQSLELMKKLKGKTRRVLRLTLVAKREKQDKKDKIAEITNMSDENLKEYVQLIKKAQPDFIHVKGFMSIGYARKRLPYNKQPWFKEVKDFAKRLQKELTKEGYKILAEEERSCVICIGKDKKGMKIKRA